jgi:hypothetical protein
MRHTRLLWLSLGCLLTVSISLLLLEKFNLVVHAHEPSVLREARQQPAEMAPDAQTPPVKFATAVASSTSGVPAYSVAVADFNRDGKPDLVVANGVSSTVGVLLGNGDGTFQAPVTYNSGGYLAFSLAAVDLNRDGKPDLVVTSLCFSSSDNCDNGGVSVLLGNGDGTLQTAVTYSSGGRFAESAAASDVNGDSYPDLVVANCGPSGGVCQELDGGVGVLLGNGDGTFQPPVIYDSGAVGTVSIAVADVNADGHSDLVVASSCQNLCYNGGVSVLLGNGDGTFRTAVTYDSGGSFASSVSISDVNGDGHHDLIVANQCQSGGNCGLVPGEVSVLMGNGDGTFQGPVSYSSVGENAVSAAVADVNGDGNIDLIVANECRQPNRHCAFRIGGITVLLGNGDGNFQAPLTFGTGGDYASSLAIADVNGDGRPDLVVADQGTNGILGPGAVGVLLNLTRFGSTTTVMSSPNPSQVNQSVAFTATVTSRTAIPNGATVAFYDGATKIGTGTTTGGVAHLTTSFSIAKTHTIKAKYPGDAFHRASSGIVYQVVNP